jgi:hypothetical protein
MIGRLEAMERTRPLRHGLAGQDRAGHPLRAANARLRWQRPPVPPVRAVMERIQRMELDPHELRYDLHKMENMVRRSFTVRQLGTGQQLTIIKTHHKLGKGGFGNVYQGYCEELQQPVAVKVLPLKEWEKHEYVSAQHFERCIKMSEIGAYERVHAAGGHPNILTMHGWWQVRSSPAGTPAARCAGEPHQSNGTRHVQGCFHASLPAKGAGCPAAAARLARSVPPTPPRPAAAGARHGHLLPCARLRGQPRAGAAHQGRHARAQLREAGAQRTPG